MLPETALSPRPTLYLIDGSAYVYRAFFALPTLNNSRGLQTNAVYGFTTTLLKIIRDGPAFYASLGVETDMPAFGHVLSEGEMAAVLAYIKSTWPPEIRAHSARINEQAQ